MERTELYAAVLVALRRHAFDNRGMLTPPQLKAHATSLVDILLDGPSSLANEIIELNAQGLVLVSIVAGGVALEQSLSDVSVMRAVATNMGQVLLAVHLAELATMRREQEMTQQVIARTVSEANARTAALSSLVMELSTPVVPIYDGILVVPLIGAIDTSRANDITEQLLHNITVHHADHVIIDITGVAAVDTSVVQHLLQTVRAASLLGTTAILVGISPPVAQTITQLGVELGNLPTLSNLQAGIAFALRRRGLAIRALQD